MKELPGDFVRWERTTWFGAGIPLEETPAELGPDGLAHAVAMTKPTPERITDRGWRGITTTWFLPTHRMPFDYFTDVLNGSA
jgi:hypothetical protein